MSFEQPQFVHDEIMPAIMFRYARYLGQDFDVSGAIPSQPQPSSKSHQQSPQKQAPSKPQQSQSKQSSTPVAAPKSSPATIQVTTSFPPQPLPEIISHDEIMPAMMFKYVKYLKDEFHTDITTQQPSLHFGVHHTSQQKQAAAQSKQQPAPKAQAAPKQASQPAPKPQQSTPQPDLASIVLTELMAIRELLVQQQEIHNQLLAERSKLQETHDKLKYRANHLQKSIDEEKAKQSQPKVTPVPTPAKVEAKVEAKETKVETKAQAKPETKVETKTPAKPDAKIEAKQETKSKTASPVKPPVQPKTEPTPVPTPVTITAAVSTPAPATTTTTPTTTTTSTPTSRGSISVPALIDHHNKEIEKATPKVDVVPAGKKPSVSTPNPKGSPKGSPKKITQKG